MMNKSEIEYKITDVKAEFVRLQNDMEKLESVGGNAGPIQNQLDELQTELTSLYAELAEWKKQNPSS